MKKIIYTEDQRIDVEFIATANCWRTVLLIDEEQFEIEIDLRYHKSEIVDWRRFEMFIVFLSEPGRLKGCVNQTKVLALNFARTRSRNVNEIKEWEVSFSNEIYYNGIEEANFLFSLIYRFHHPTGAFGDDYGLYLADFKSNNLIGVRRCE